MRKSTVKTMLDDGSFVRQAKELKKLLNLNYLQLANRTQSCGQKDLPALYCEADEYPDFLALYSEKSLYRKTDSTAVCFFEFDSEFDGIHGLFNAIYYDDTKLLEKYKERFRGVRYVITPDYSELGDIHVIENEYRLFKARIIGLWFLFEIGAIVIPNITFPTEESCGFATDGLEGCSIICFSTKGHMDSAGKRARLKRHVHLTLEKLHPKAIVVYDVCSSDEETLFLFSEAIEKGIEVIIAPNTLKARNEVAVAGRASA